MKILSNATEFIKNSQERDFIKYIIIFLLILASILGLLIFIHNSKINRYTAELENINTERKKTKKILSNYRIITQQQNQIEKILSQDKNFLIAKRFNEILDALNLSQYQKEQPKHITGETVSGKIESIITPHLSDITMKQLTDLLSTIADVPQIYPKELIIEKNPNAQTINIDLTIATLEEPTST